MFPSTCKAHASAEVVSPALASRQALSHELSLKLQSWPADQTCSCVLAQCVRDSHLVLVWRDANKAAPIALARHHEKRVQQRSQDDGSNCPGNDLHDAQQLCWLDLL